MPSGRLAELRQPKSPSPEMDKDLLKRLGVQLAEPLRPRIPRYSDVTAPRSAASAAVISSPQVPPKPVVSTPSEMTTGAIYHNGMVDTAGMKEPKPGESVKFWYARPPFTRAAVWPGRRVIPMPEGDEVGNLVRIRTHEGNPMDSHYSSSDNEVVIPHRKGQRPDQLVRIHEQTHALDPAMTDRPTREVEIPAAIAETRFALAGGDRPPPDAAWKAWMTEHFRQHGPKVSPRLSSLENERNLSFWLQDLRSKDSNLGKAYRAWIESENTSGIGAETPVRRKFKYDPDTIPYWGTPQGQHTTKLPPGIDTSNPKVQAFLKKLQGK